MGDPLVQILTFLPAYLPRARRDEWMRIRELIRPLRAALMSKLKPREG